MFWHHIDDVDDLLGMVTVDVSQVADFNGSTEDVVTYTCVTAVQDTDDEIRVSGREVFVLRTAGEEVYESAVFVRRVSASGAVNRCVRDRCSEGPRFSTLEEAIQWLVT
jgi:hypothetical protein